MIKDENYINLQGWMVTKLGLRGQELVCYALIYGFSQDGQSKFSGSSSYIAEWLKITKHAAREVLKKLVNKGLLLKHDKTVNGVKLCDYTAVIPGGLNNDGVGQKDTEGWVKNAQGVGQKDTGGGSKTYPHNNIDNNQDTNSLDIDIKENVKRKDPEPDFSFTGKPLEPVMLKWLEYRKQIKKPYKSQMTIETCYKHLEDLSRGSLDLAEKIVDQSIANQWQGLFELKLGNGNTQPNGGAQNGGTVGKYAGIGRKFSNEA